MTAERVAETSREQQALRTRLEVEQATCEATLLRAEVEDAKNARRAPEGAETASLAEARKLRDDVARAQFGEQSAVVSYHACFHEYEEESMARAQVEEQLHWCWQEEHALAEELRDSRVSYIGHGHVTRILSDYYGRGVVRSNQESVDLRVYTRDNDVHETIICKKQ